jgi:hypothetical protein
VPINDDILFQYYLLTPGTIMNNGTKHHLKVSSTLSIDFDCDDASLISAYSTPPKTNNQLYTNKKTYATALCSNTIQTTQPMTISPTIASSDLTTKRSSRIEKLLAQLTEKNATLETSQTTLQNQCHN